ncbi:Zinc finger RING/FYVE/PHD-type protein [Dioscorea alata]|uniref:Zinc finger RING/FYVE/PHD-type protein n=1 Tax=Dioscorea alata TaxID=55571 RepID=A0ACB7TT21_DIOAL|nr:Zinc finger RING/FYVE/PHD-type protein [Dioscorea alata]
MQRGVSRYASGHKTEERDRTATLARLGERSHIALKKRAGLIRNCLAVRKRAEKPRGTSAPRRGRQGTVGARPWCNGRVSAAPTGRAAGHDAHGRAKPGRPGDGRHRRESGSIAGRPAKFRVAHRQPPGRAMAVRVMSRATGGTARANPRHTQPREGHRCPAADGRAPLGPAPGAMGGLARLQLGGQRGTTRTAGQNRGDRGTGDTTARAAASPDHRPRSEWLTGSHPDAPWSCGQCPERRGAPRARTPATPNRERDNAHGPAKPGGQWPGGAATCAAALPCHRPRSGRPTGSHPDAPWPCAPCPELLSAPRARPTPMYPNISPPPTIPAKHPAQSNAGGTKGL